jgi:hypothetical protein
VVYHNPPTKKNRKPIEKVKKNRKDTSQYYKFIDVVFSAVAALLCRLPTKKKASRELDFQPPKLPLSA